MSTHSDRYGAMLDWIAGQTALAGATINPASNDASFRRYFRLSLADGTSQIVMDAPPEHEDCEPFIRIANLLKDAGINAPVCGDFDSQQGFLLLSDLGNETLLQRLKRSAKSADTFYSKALEILAAMQVIPASGCSAYNEALLQQEMGLFRDWLLAEHLSLHLGQAQQDTLQQQFDLLATSALVQPTVLVHRDYHSRNLMLDGNDQLGVLDFQDAVIGPITYDAVSLLRDCYISWPDAQVYGWLREYYQRLCKKKLTTVDFETFQRWFDWMGVQRHLKAAGIFCRLLHRDGKGGYINDIPRTLNYVLQVTGRYRELQPLHELVRDCCAIPFELSGEPDAPC